ncbi:MAG: UDP-2,4-diacetamido-2,4,6-trideoxy-beta-L-altropyranose hydrolase [Lachnospiraceae bacterium]|nr:UDP-2,4-diacetamido-2,4,6-trideoxy-beta-L-altropyranose hydrolase [Lachnospiraceae bacterium]
MKILACIPARGGSKRIPRKNVRLLCGIPLILYSVKNALRLSEVFDMDICVSTDDEELAGIVEGRGGKTEVIMREAALAADDITLDPVIYDSLCKMEARHGVTYDVVITLQATSPTLKYETIVSAIRYFEKDGFDTVISVVNRPHLSWTMRDGRIEKNYEVRLNSQLLPPCYLETGGFLITKRSEVSVDSRIGENVSVYETPADEAVDIDTYEDWLSAESILRKKKILLYTVGKRKLGMGHIYRCLSLAYKLMGHDLLFVLDESSDMGIERLKESFFPYRVIKTESDLEKVIQEFEPDIIINDVLDTATELIRMEKKHGARIVNFEDQGEGSRLADVVINALYEEHAADRSNIYEGSEYYFIRDEFLEQSPKEFSEECRNVLIIFGGSDPSDLTGRLYKLCLQLHEDMPGVSFDFLTGFGYDKKDQVVSVPEKNVFVHNDVKRVSNYMRKADIAITSQGRTIYELASLGVPAIVLAQNEREALHVFAGIQNGFINLGLGKNADDSTIVKTVKWLADTPNVRKQMRSAELSREFALGQKRVIDLILKQDK